jgi:hypothetical protein
MSVFVRKQTLRGNVNRRYLQKVRVLHLTKK